MENLMATVKEYCPECGRGEWVGLTDEERDRFVYIDEKDKKRFRKYAEYVEQTLKEKNATN